MSKDNFLFDDGRVGCREVNNKTGEEMVVEVKSSIEEQAIKQAEDYMERRFPYCQISKSLLLDNNISPKAKLIYCILIAYSKEAEKVGYEYALIAQIPVRIIASHLNVSETYTWKKMKELIENEWIKPIRQGRMEANKYLLFRAKKDVFSAWVRIKKVNLKLAHDRELATRLRRSLHKKGIHEAIKEKTQGTISLTGAREMSAPPTESAPLTK